jgi:hypothetical protein
MGTRIMKRRWNRSRFDDTPEDPQASLVNLVDVMLVLVCGLMIALFSAQRARESATSQPSAPRIVQQGRELADLPESLRGEQAGNGMEPVGQVYRDPETGKLILVGP